MKLVLHVMAGAILVLAVPGYTGGGETADAPPDAPASMEGVEAPALGELATLHTAADSTVSGYAVKVRAADGTEAWGIFRGPQRLGEQLSGGTWTFHADSLPIRVRAAAAGERVRAGGA